MSNHKFAAADVHAATTTFAVLDDSGKFVMETVVETKAESLLSVVKSISGAVHLTYEEGTHAAWLYGLLRPHVAELLVCDPRKNRNNSSQRSSRCLFLFEQKFNKNLPNGLLCEKILSCPID